MCSCRGVSSAPGQASGKRHRTAPLEHQGWTTEPSWSRPGCERVCTKSIPRQGELAENAHLLLRISIKSHRSQFAASCTGELASYVSIPYYLKTPQLLTSLLHSIEKANESFQQRQRTLVPFFRRMVRNAWAWQNGTSMAAMALEVNTLLHIIPLIQYSQQTEIQQYVLNWFVIVNTYY